jgi:hypothetical protein
MASKKYTGKTCAYCGRPEVSATRDHVVAKEFFLPEGRANLPLVPACAECNGQKAKLEHYALSVLPLGSRHHDARRYGEQNIERRLQKNRALRTRLTVQHSGLWERHPNGLLVPTMSLKIEGDKIQQLVSLIVRGLFMFHWKNALGPEWFADPAMFHPAYEDRAIGPLMRYFERPAAVAEGNLGCNTFVYRGLRCAYISQLSIWQLRLFGGLQFGGDTKFPDGRFTKFSVVTRQTEAAAQATRARVDGERIQAAGSEVLS